MPEFRQGWQSFKAGLDRRDILAYWKALWNHAWETWWGGGVIGTICTIFTLYYAPSRWILGWVVALVFLVAGYYIWRADHARLQPSFAITKVIAQTWGDPDNGNHGMLYYFEVVNKSETTSILEAEAQLSEITPTVEHLEWLPVHLIHKHDRSIPLATTFNLHPGKSKHIDFVSALEKSNRFNVHHSVDGVNRQVVGGDCRRLKVTITGKDVAPLAVWFDVYFDSEGFFVCEMEEEAHPPLNLTRRQRRAVASSAKSALAPCRGPWHLSQNAPGATCPKCGLAFPREQVTLDHGGMDEH